jgi:hypothetical protein
MLKKQALSYIIPPAMKTFENIKKIALIFFILTGIAHFGSSILIANELYLKEALIANKTMDIPFILTGLIYGLSCLRLSFTNPEKDHKKLDILMISIVVIVLIALIVINLVLPDLNA